MTQLDSEHEGSITLPCSLCSAAGMTRYEKVLVADCETGVQFETYIIYGPEGVVGINCVAAKLNIRPGNRLIIMAFEYIGGTSARFDISSRIVVCDDKNNIKSA
ncbi:MAG: aspartate 1-decarboxylase [Candidatus Competibacteraceae bacterium]|nr:aspartate 1-decarboxylase [Candidatus Competibacteraceae bacterium]